MFPAPRMAFSHIGLYVTDIDAMVRFYTGVLGFCVTDRATIRGADVVFISRNPQEHHQIVLVPGRAPGSASTLNQVSFRLPSLSELRRVHAELVALQVCGLNPTNHGGSWSFHGSRGMECAVAGTHARRGLAGAPTAANPLTPAESESWDP